jgi:hypothetical protein
MIFAAHDLYTWIWAKLSDALHDTARNPHVMTLSKMSMHCKYKYTYVCVIKMVCHASGGMPKSSKLTVC